MRGLLFSTLALIAAVSALNVPGLPSCAGSCVSTDFGGCGSFNVTCICSNGPLIANLACCVSKVCSAADQETTIQFADALCQGNGVTNLPTSATCAPGAQSTIAGASSATSSVSVTGTAAAAISSASSAAQGNSTSSGTASGTKSTTVLTGTAAGSSNTASASASAKSTGNAGSKLQAGAAGVGALLVGAIAAL